MAKVIENMSAESQKENEKKMILEKLREVVFQKENGHQNQFFFIN